MGSLSHATSRVYLQHDLMVELGRIEMEMESQATGGGESPSRAELKLQELEGRLQKIRLALSRLQS